MKSYDLKSFSGYFWHKKHRKFIRTAKIALLRALEGCPGKDSENSVFSRISRILSQIRCHDCIVHSCVTSLLLFLSRNQTRLSRTASRCASRVIEIESPAPSQVRTTPMEYRRKKDGSAAMAPEQYEMYVSTSFLSILIICQFRSSILRTALEGVALETSNQHLKLKGQMMLLKSGQHIM